MASPNNDVHVQRMLLNGCDLIGAVVAVVLSLVMLQLPKKTVYNPNSYITVFLFLCMRVNKL